MEVTSDNGYGITYGDKKNYEIRGIKYLDDEVIPIDPIGPFVSQIPVNPPVDLDDDEDLDDDDDLDNNVLDYFIFDVLTSNDGESNNNQFTLPLRSGYTYDFQVDWGDGTTGSYAGEAGDDILTDITHTYATPDEYRIRIGVINNTGFPTIYFDNSGDKEKLINTVDFGDVGWEILENSFSGCSNNVIDPTATANFNAVLNADFAWENNNLTSFPAIDLSSARFVNGTWQNNLLTSFPSINLTSGNQFANAWQNNNLTSFPDIDLPNASILESAWQNNNLTSFPDIDLSDAINVNSAWQNNLLTSFPEIDLSSAIFVNGTWQNNLLTSFPDIDLPNAINVKGAWQDNDLNSFPEIDLSSGTNFENAWRGNGVMISFATRNFYEMNNGRNCFEGTTLPTSDWSNILVTQSIDNNNVGTIFVKIPFHGGNSKYNTTAAGYRSNLEGTKHWEITDGGLE